MNEIIEEHHRSELLRSHGLEPRNRILLEGPPGNGKTSLAEVLAAELMVPFYAVRYEGVVSSFLGETTGRIDHVFEFARTRRCVLFFDEFDAIARARDEDGEHNELRRVVNSLLIFIDRIQPKGYLVAATNLDHALDAAIWRRFDEVVWFDRPDQRMVARFLKMKFKNVAIAFDPADHLDVLQGHSYAELDRICVQAIKATVRETGEMPPDQAQAVRSPELIAALTSEDSLEGVRAFREKRAPVWQGK